jgi:xanthine dehydrogenase accessory factor
MLASGKQSTHLERFSLGASLGQCCGGVTVLLFEPMGQVQAQIAVFGAGHVGRALVPLLASLPCRVRWIDSREAEFPEQIPHGVRKIVSEEPVDEIDDLPAGSYCIVMTHNHQLDLELTAAILKRNDFTYFGLIGSKTKRVKFEHRLRDRGFDSSRAATHALPDGHRRSQRQVACGNRHLHRRRNHRHLQREFRPANCQRRIIDCQTAACFECKRRSQAT